MEPIADHALTDVHLVLASSSPYRRQLLQRLGLPFAWEAPDIDESALPGELPEALVVRLAGAKAAAVASRHGKALVIGSDQVAVHDDAIVGKPGDHENALRQLRQLRGANVRFITGVHVIDGRSGRNWSDRVEFEIQFRDYTEREIGRYLEKARPYDCTAAFRSEDAGITLVERMRGDDPTGLIGLPLIALGRILRDAGLLVP